jgi:hypothetical protein
MINLKLLEKQEQAKERNNKKIRAEINEIETKKNR